MLALRHTLVVVCLTVALTASGWLGVGLLISSLSEPVASTVAVALGSVVLLAALWCAARFVPRGRRSAPTLATLGLLVGAALLGLNWAISTYQEAIDRARAPVENHPPFLDLGPPTTRRGLDHAWFDRETTLDGVLQQLTAALTDQGHEYSIYTYGAHGFSIVTLPERFDADGRSVDGPDRHRAPGRSGGGLAAEVTELFYAPEADYRTFVIHVLDEPFAPGDRPGDAEAFLSRLAVGGAGSLDDVGLPFTDAHEVEVFVFESHQLGGDVALVDEATMSATEHLRAAGLLDAWEGG